MSAAALSAKQEKFCQEYRVDFCGTQAAIRAGYAPKAAGQTAHKLLKLPKIQKRIAEVVKQDAKRNDVSVDRVLQEYANIGFASLEHYLEINEDTGEAFISLSNCTPDQLAALSEYTVEAYSEGRDGDAREIKRVKIKMTDKIRALDALSKHLGIFAKDNERIITPSDAWAELMNNAARPFGVRTDDEDSEAED